MDSEVDHYLVLGLPSGEEGAKLTDKDIGKGYRLKALELHPDKRPGDRNAHENFQKLKTSYEVLKDEKTRKLFDELLKIKREKVLRQSRQDSKRRKMMSDLDERERSAFAHDVESRCQNEEEIVARKLKEEIARIRAMHANKGASPAGPTRQDTMKKTKESTAGRQSGLDKEKMLKVTWEKTGEGYTAQQLRELLEEFGGVEDVLIQSSKKKKGSALVVMESKEAAVAVLGNVLGVLSNPLFIMPLQPAQPFASPASSDSQKVAESDGPKLSNLVGSGYQAFEDSVLEKLKKCGSCAGLSEAIASLSNLKKAWNFSMLLEGDAHGISDAIIQQPDDIVGDEEMEEQDEHSVSSMSYEEEVLSPNGTEL